MARSHTRLLILFLLLLMVIFLILWQTELRLHELDNKMPAIGCFLISPGQIKPR